MKNKLLLIGLMLCLFMATEATAQLSKKEKKEWKKKLKAIGPEEFKNLTEETSSLREQVNSMNGQVASLQSTLSDKNAKISNLENEVKRLESKTASIGAEDVTANNTRAAKGVVFKVQIGAFQKIDLSKYSENNENFASENMGNGTHRYTLGNFADYWEADKFKKNLRRMGVKDAWIVPYKDGKRVPMKDVLEGVI